MIDLEGVDQELLSSDEVALATLFEFAPMEHVGPRIGALAHDSNLVTLLYDSLLPGYPGWRWAVTVTKATPEEKVTVCETHLEPGDASLLAPVWVPWSERLAAFRKAQTLQAAQEAEEALAAAEELREEDEVDPDEDLLDNDFSDFDDDLDGVDIDLFDEDEEDEADVPDHEEE